MRAKANVSLIVLDTLRLDTFNRLVGANPGILDGFDAIRLDRCIAPASWTLPSHASMFTGLYPSQHGSHETKTIKSLDIDRIKLRKDTIIDDMKRIRYRTYGISANPYVHPVYGFSGFDYFAEESYFTDIFGSVIEVASHLKPLVSKYRNIYGNDVMKLSSAIMKDNPKLFLDLVLSATALSPKSAAKKAKAKLIDGWPIEKGGRSILKRVSSLEIKEPYFMFVNFMEAHDPYIGKRGMDFNWSTPFMKGDTDSKLVSKWVSLYNKASYRALRYGSDLIRHMLDRFGDNQTIILTSDHGQAFNEHKFIGHGTVLFDEVVKVPLIIIAPRADSNRKPKGYQSLVNLRKFILASAKGDSNPIDMLTSSKAYSETFSIPANISREKNLDKRKMAKFDRRIRRSFG
ncbi:MAG: sulfatase-like hydrolase/transferase [Candidatus Micrarchaeaceae archaeon]